MRIKGFTLIELLIVMAILPLVLVVLTTVFVTISDGQMRTIAQASMDQQQQYLFSRMAADVLRATQLLDPATPGATANQIRLQLPEGQVLYSLAGGTLSRADATSSAAVTSRRVLIDSFTATRLGSPSGFPTVRVTVSLSSTASATQEQLAREAQTTFGLRMKP